MYRFVLGAGAAAALTLGASPGMAGDRVPLAGAPCGAPGRMACAPAPDDRPVGAKPGQCFAKVRTPPRLETFVEQVVVTPARREPRTIPAEYEYFQQQVMVSPERMERIDVPATYRTVHETVVVRPAGVRLERTPPVWDTIVETVLVRPAYTEWRRSYVRPNGYLPVGYRQTATGEIMCLVEVPATYDRVQRRVMVRPAGAIEVREPAITKVVARQVVDRPAHFVERRIPPVFRTERVKRIVRAERTEFIDIPAVVRSVKREREVAPGREEWRAIDCPPKAAVPAPPAVETRGIPPRMERGERG